MWSKIPSVLKNKYLLAFLAVFIWLLFFDNHSIVQQWRLQRQLNELRRERMFYLEEINRDSTEIERLRNDPDAMERYARENYMMKRENEDIYIIVEE